MGATATAQKCVLCGNDNDEELYSSGGGVDFYCKNGRRCEERRNSAVSAPEAIPDTVDDGSGLSFGEPMIPLGNHSQAMGELQLERDQLLAENERLRQERNRAHLPSQCVNCEELERLRATAEEWKECYAETLKRLEAAQGDLVEERREFVSIEQDRDRLLSERDEARRERDRLRAQAPAECNAVEGSCRCHFCGATERDNPVDSDGTVQLWRCSDHSACALRASSHPSPEPPAPRVRGREPIVMAADFNAPMELVSASPSPTPCEECERLRGWREGVTWTLEAVLNRAMKAELEVERLRNRYEPKTPSQAGS